MDPISIPDPTLRPRRATRDARALASAPLRSTLLAAVALILILIILPAALGAIGLAAAG